MVITYNKSKYWVLKAGLSRFRAHLRLRAWAPFGLRVLRLLGFGSFALGFGVLAKIWV